MTRNSTIDLGCNWELFRRVVKTAFNQRRKMLRSSLKPLFNVRMPDEAFWKRDIMTMRPEQLIVKDFVALTNMVSEELNNRE